MARGGKFREENLPNFISMEIKPFDIFLARRCLRPVLPDAHKGTQGHALLIGGSHGKMGAVMLSVMGALRSGCGLVTGLIPECGYTAFQTAVPEAMALTSGRDAIADFSHAISADAIGVGPGLGTDSQTVHALLAFMEKQCSSMVLDADALNIISHNTEYLAKLPRNTILTPHPGEFRRLFGSEPSPEAAVALANKYQIIIVLKGAPTHVAAPEGCFVNTTGNQGLATGGSGDVLTGIITGLLAQGHSPMEAALLGTFLHGLSADIGIRQTGIRSFIARDIVGHLGSAFRIIG